MVNVTTSKVNIKNSVQQYQIEPLKRLIDGSQSYSSSMHLHTSCFNQQAWSHIGIHHLETMIRPQKGYVSS